MSAHDEKRKGGEPYVSLPLVASMFAERAAFIAQNADRIAVRVEIDGRWQGKYLGELPAALAIAEAFRLLLRHDDPYVEEET